MDFGGVTIQITDNAALVLDAFQAVVPRALERCGMQAEGYAKDLCAVDTGRLRARMKSLTAVGNGGSLYCIYATDSSNRNALKRYIHAQLTETIYTTKNESYSLERIIALEARANPFEGIEPESVDDIKVAVVKATRELIRGCEQYGFRYIEHKA